MAYQTILEAFEPPEVALITLNRPQAANALSQKMAEELRRAVLSAQENPVVRVIVLTGAGERAFCAGADLKERKGMDKKAWEAQHQAFEQARHAILQCPKPVIAAVNGAAMGGGLELALACDFIYASEFAMLGLTEARLGIMPGMGGTQTLTRAVGARRAKEMMFRAEPIGAKEARHYGLVNEVCGPHDLLPRVKAVAQQIAANAPLSLIAIKKAVAEGASKDLGEALGIELRHYNRLLETKDRHEGIDAFNEKRRPLFKGE